MPRDNEITQLSDTGSQQLTEEMIRTRVYQLYEERGCEDGHELDDWLPAEAEITGKKLSRRLRERRSLHRVAAA